MKRLPRGSGCGVAIEAGPLRHRVFDIRFFWQLITAFAVVTVLVWGGMFLAGRHALAKLEDVVRTRADSISVAWASRLSDYYAGHSGWEGVGSLLEGDVDALGWDPAHPGWPIGYVLAASDGTVISASIETLVGDKLDGSERAAAAEIVADGKLVGLLFVSETDPMSLRGSGVGRAALRTFLFTGLAIATGSLVVGLVFSRGMSRPLVDLTEAVGAVASGDLGVRVPVRHQGEIGERRDRRTRGRVQHDD